MKLNPGPDSTPVFRKNRDSKFTLALTKTIRLPKINLLIRSDSVNLQPDPKQQKHNIATNEQQ